MAVAITSVVEHQSALKCGDVFRVAMRVGGYCIRFGLFIEENYYIPGSVKYIDLIDLKVREMRVYAADTIEVFQTSEEIDIL